jgi:hypothetical protein
MTAKKIKFILAAIWVYVLVIYVSLLTKVQPRRVESFLAFSGLIICYLIISASYFFVFKGIRKQRKIQPASQSSNIQQKTEHELAKTIAIIIIIFTISWAPMGYTLFVHQDVEILGNYHYLPHWVATVGMGTAVINPLIYFGRKQAFRDAARALVCKTT